MSSPACSDLCGLGAPSTSLRTCFAGDTPTSSCFIAPGSLRLISSQISFQVEQQDGEQYCRQRPGEPVAEAHVVSIAVEDFHLGCRHRFGKHRQGVDDLPL